jgi:hypothetical protein
MQGGLHDSGLLWGMVQRSPAVLSPPRPETAILPSRKMGMPVCPYAILSNTILQSCVRKQTILRALALGTVLLLPLALQAQSGPDPSFMEWSWGKRIAFVALIMGAIVVVSQTLGKYEWPEEWGGRPKPGGKPIRPEDLRRQREAERRKAAEGAGRSPEGPPKQG